MDIGKAFSYVLDDPKWLKKVLMASFMSAVPTLGIIIVIGWLLDTLRNINAGQPHPIPDWSGDHLARWFGRGVAATVVVMAWVIPCLLVAGIILGGFQLLNWGVVGALSFQRDWREVGGVLGTVLLCCGTLFQVVVALVILLGAIVPYVRFAATDRLDVGLEYITNFQLLLANIGPYLLVVVIVLVALFVALVLIALTCGLGALIVLPYFQLVVTHLLAGLSRLSEKKA